LESFLDNCLSYTEELEIIKAQMDERGESMTDTGPLVKLKEAMKKVKKEIKVLSSMSIFLALS
jgi:estrogen-related receptor beta like 1